MSGVSFRQPGAVMSGVSFRQPGALNGCRVLEESVNPTREEVYSQQLAQDGQSFSEEKDCCGCYLDVNKSKELLADYLESASIHGIAQTKGPQYYSWRRPVWLLLILVMSIALSWTLYRQISSLYHYPIKTVTKITINDNLPFPAVTICNLNQYIRERLPDDPMIEKVLYAQSEYAGISRHLGYSHKLPDLDNLTDVPGEELRRIALHAAPKLKDLMLLCKWGAKTYNCQDIFRPLHTGYGTCYVFNGPDIAPDNLARAVSAFSQLRVLMTTLNNQTYFSKLIHAGVKVLVHQPDEMPFPLFSGWFVRPGVAASMALTRHDSKCLPYPFQAYSNAFCEDSKAEGYKNRLKHYQLYTAENCLNDCLYEQLEETCGCRHYFAKGNRSICSAKQLLTCYMPKNDAINTNDAQHCGCLRECETITYTADLSYANFATGFIKNQAVKDRITVFNDYLDENVIDLRVYFASLNVMEVIQEPEMNKWTVIGTLGGQLGLFLGASTLSFVELIEILLLLLVTYIRRAFYTATGRKADAAVSGSKSDSST
ncbi:hypothetical protein RRG08_038674 [Elysia crispata]|uniref:Uncharacterized protein n=1 Tax=Elysia crispata TaxID=231223 RepID=A0AAE1DGX8_9GAST|nr:hypothetical protein RRG08_038674 [Elysia crispata]